MSDREKIAEKLRAAYEDWRNADTTAQLHADPEDYDAQALAEAAEEAAWAWDQAASLFMLNADAILAALSHEWRPITKQAIEELGDAGQRFFASITVTNRFTGATHIETSFLYLAERETEEGAMYYEAAVVGTDDETGWDIEDYEYYMPFDVPTPHKGR